MCDPYDDIVSTMPSASFRPCASRLYSRGPSMHYGQMRKLAGFLCKLLLAGAVLAGLLLIYLDAIVSATFTERRWELPAKVYARPLELYPGRPLGLEELQYELRLLGYQPVAQLDAPGEFTTSAGGALEFYSRYFAFADELAPATRVRLRFAGGALKEMSGVGGNLDLYRLEPVQIGGIYPRHREDRLLVQLNEVPRTMQAALLVVEDKNFFRHRGLSLSGVARALLANLRAGRVEQGGSTLTQQLVKNFYLSGERSLTRKAIEAMMAILLELHYDKRAILQAYINEVFLAQDGPRAIHGFALASQYFFGWPLEQVGLHQQALLVGMVKGPSLYSPLRHPERALKRRNLVLELMREAGVITGVEAEVATAMPLDLSGRPRAMNSYPAFLDLVRRQLRRDYREQDLGSLGLGIFTSFDPLLQRRAEQSISRVLDRIDPGKELQTALVVTSFDNGEVRALIGGRSPRFAGFNRALDALRPVGSLLKPAVYLNALEQDGRYTLATPISDAPVTVRLENGDEWSPRNFDRQSHGAVLLHRALSQSYNQASVRLGMELGLEPVLETLRKLGLERPLPAVPAMLLGAGAMAPIEIAVIYQTIAAGGFRLPLHTIRDVVDAQGNILQRFPLHYDRVVSPQSMHLLHYALQEVVREGTGKTLYRYLPESFAVAGKTGTTNDNRDSWFAGFSGDLMSVSWVGRDDNGDTGLTGATGALKIWGDFMAMASRRGLAYRVPEGIEHYWVDENTGKLSASSCQGSRLIPFVKGSEPRQNAPCQRLDRGILQWFRELF